MSELPDGWAEVPLLSVSELHRGVTYGRNDARSAPGDGLLPVIRANNIQDRAFDIRDLVYVPKSLISDTQLVVRGDVVVATSSGSISIVGKAAQATENLNAGFGAFCGLLRPCGVYPQYFGFYFSSDIYRKTVSSLARGVNINNLKRSHFDSLQFPLAPLREQKRIADKLEAVLGGVDNCRARLSRVPDLLKRFRKSVLAAAASGRLTEDWRNTTSTKAIGADIIANDAKLKAALLRVEPALAKKKSTNESSIDEEYVFPLPDTWSFTTWGTVSEWITYGFTRPMPSSAKGVKMVTAKDVVNFHVDLAGARFTPDIAFDSLSEKDKPKRGDLLLTKDGTIGRAAMVDTEEPFCINQSVAVCWLRSTQMVKSYLEIVVNAEFTQDFIREKAQGMAIQHLSITDFAKCPLPVPPLEEQQEIARRVKTLFAFADRIDARLTEAQAIIDRITPSTLAKAFRGELIPQDPSDESASILLERIRTQRTNDAAQPRQKKLKAASTMKKLTTEALKQTIQELPHKEFDFDELSRAVSADYDQLSGMLINLLGEQPPTLKQEFDKRAKKMRFVRIAI